MVSSSATPEIPLSAAVLAGGQSRRMGQDKALLPLDPGGPPLLRIVLDRLAAVADDRFIVATDRPAYGDFGVPVYGDDVAGAGTLAGIATALRLARHDHCLVVACDMPFLNPSLLAWMAARPRTYDALVPRLPGESKQARGAGHTWQTLHAIYVKRCLPAINRRLAEDDRKVISFFDGVRVEAVDAEQVRLLDPDLRSFFNANTPEALDSARRALEQRPRVGVLDSGHLY